MRLTSKSAPEFIETVKFINGQKLVVTAWMNRITMQLEYKNYNLALKATVNN